MVLTLQTTKDGLCDRLGAATCEFIHKTLDRYVDFSKVQLSCYGSILTVYLPCGEGDECPGDVLKRFETMGWHYMIAAIAARMGDLVTGMVVKGDEFEMKPSDPGKYVQRAGIYRTMARDFGLPID